jgi:hypothetical protein
MKPRTAAAEFPQNLCTGSRPISAFPCAKSASLIRRHVRFGKNPPIYVYDTSGIYTDPDQN